MTEPAGTWAIIAGGGTAGHVLPGISIGRELVDRGCDRTSIHFVGSARGIEARLVPEAGFGLTMLPGRGIERRLTIANIGAVVGLIRALFGAVLLVRRRRPAVVVGLGGYASLACGLAAVVWRVPLVLAEQNAVPGAANRFLGRWARASAVSFEGTELPRAVVTGNPVRPEVLAVDRGRDRREARLRIGVEGDRSVLVAFGGSLGARRINEAVVAALPGWHDRDDLHIRHVTGSRDHEDLARRAPLEDTSPLSYDLIEYEEDMPTVYAAADLALCRAGATSVAELAAVGCPSILVPLPSAPGDHQTANARALAEAGGATVVADADLDAGRLASEVDSLLADPGSLASMGRAAAGFARRDAAASVADLVIRHARRSFGVSRGEDHDG
jgi:UDP-N-acetylglucosamine--N-acetylmuramyl-(pentapeptide) pyrophosphoryl-undecaprenol N-acetylglucosamine transferase